tara:strand:+ start:5382 stop:6113 length:732 start_codon:yes stop_codon:yes gene_type:complete
LEITPNCNPFDSDLLKDENYRMIWYLEKDTAKLEIGKISTNIKVHNHNVCVTKSVALVGVHSKWVDTTIAKIKNLKPIYFSSFNEERDMVLKFDEFITGYFFDKKANDKIDIGIVKSNLYFDSNIYPQLIRWLPLKSEYQAVIKIFDYKPYGISGALNVYIMNTVKGEYIASEDDIRSVWIVTVADEIGDGKTINTYYIDTETRKIWKQEVVTAGRKMVMEVILNEIKLPQVESFPKAKASYL